MAVMGMDTADLMNATTTGLVDASTTSVSVAHDGDVQAAIMIQRIYRGHLWRTKRSADRHTSCVQSHAQAGQHIASCHIGSTKSVPHMQTALETHTTTSMEHDDMTGSMARKQTHVQTPLETHVTTRVRLSSSGTPIASARPSDTWSDLQAQPQPRERLSCARAMRASRHTSRAPVSPTKEASARFEGDGRLWLDSSESHSSSTGTDDDRAAGCARSKGGVVSPRRELIRLSMRALRTRRPEQGDQSPSVRFQSVSHI
jgi:hypothetical protein